MKTLSVAPPTTHHLAVSSAKKPSHSISVRRIMSRTNSNASSALSFVRGSFARDSQPVVIELENHYSSKVYTSGSVVAGVAVIRPWKDCFFTNISISLLGVTSTRSEVAQVAQQATHTFLRLDMPIDESFYPSPQVFRAGSSYSVPFHFIIPDHLSLSACRHRNKHDNVTDQHLRMPPSVGHWQVDDLSPEMARINYSVRVRINEANYDPSQGEPMLEAARRIQVLPTSVEDPPLTLSPQERLYAPTKSAKIRKNLFSSKLGRITASAMQPSPIMVHPSGRAHSDVSVHVNLQFEPTSPAIAPPELDFLSAKLQAFTWFAGSPADVLPDIGDKRALAFSNNPYMNYSTSLPLVLTEKQKMSWRSSSASSQDSIGRKPSSTHSEISDSTGSGQMRKSSSSSGQCEGKIEAQFEISPSTERMLLPTFHSCLISRTYTLHVELSLGGSKLSLAVPVQVVVEPSPSSQSVYTMLPSFDDVVGVR